MSSTAAKPSLVSSNSQVYLSYDVDNPPPHPGKSWTRFVCISDTHSRKYPVPPGDVLLHAGDLSSWGEYRQLDVTMQWLKDLPHPVKIVIAGNHDLCLDEEWREHGPWHQALGRAIIKSKDTDAAKALVRSETMRNAGILYLEYGSTTFTTGSGRTWEVYGSPATPRYATGSFQYEGGVASTKGDEIYARIPPSTEVLLTHTPPYGICDLTRRKKHAGCYALSDRLKSEDLRKCRLHVFGHIHEGRAAELSGEEGQEGGRTRVSVNAAVAEGRQAVIVDLAN